MDRKRMKRAVREMIIAIGEDPDSEELKRTPERVADTFEFMTRGKSVSYKLEPLWSGTSDMIVLKGIKFFSLCEHHLLPFCGEIDIAYVPENKVYGISKLPLLVEKYSKRLQLQERLTAQIADEIALTCRGCMVICRANHMCMQMKGTQRENIEIRSDAEFVTSAIRGIFCREDVKSEALKLLGR